MSGERWEAEPEASGRLVVSGGSSTLVGTDTLLAQEEMMSKRLAAHWPGR